MYTGPAYEIYQMMAERETNNDVLRGMKIVAELYENRGYLPTYSDWEAMSDEDKKEYAMDFSFDSNNDGSFVEKNTEKKKGILREIKTLEVDKYVPSEKPGMMKHVGMVSPQEAFDVLAAHLKKEGLMPDEYFQANYWAWKDIKELPNYRKAACSVNWGGSEGIYLDIELLYEDEKHVIQRLPFATGKTLGESGDDYLKMSRIGAECSMMLNGRGDIVRFYEDEKKIENPTLVEKAALYDASCEKMNKFLDSLKQRFLTVPVNVCEEFQKCLEECGMLTPSKQESLENKIKEAASEIQTLKTESPTPSKEIKEEIER